MRKFIPVIAIFVFCLTQQALADEPAIKLLFDFSETYIEDTLDESFNIEDLEVWITSAGYEDDAKKMAIFLGHIPEKPGSDVEIRHCTCWPDEQYDFRVILPEFYGKIHIGVNFYDGTVRLDDGIPGNFKSVHHRRNDIENRIELTKTGRGRIHMSIIE